MGTRKCPEDSVDRFGLTEVYHPDTVELVDVVLVHGLNGHPYHTWTSEEDKIFWPAELLPAVLKEEKARILVYGYDADMASFSDSMSEDKIHNHAEHLVATLCANRRIRNATERPIIFVAYSIGGLIVKRALNHSSGIQGQHTEHLRAIFTSTYAILFLATPHMGSGIAEQDPILKSIRGASQPTRSIDTELQLINFLKAHTEILENIDRQFVQLASKLHIYFFHEGKPTNLRGSWRYIVAEESAAPNIQDVERSCIQQDHFHICKFENNGTPGFDLVTEAIQRYASHAPETVVRRWVEEKRERETRKLAKVDELRSSIAGTIPEVLEGNSLSQASGLSITANADFVNGYSKSFLRPVVSYVQRPRLHSKIKEALHDRLGDGIQDAQILVIWGLGGAGKSQLVRYYVQKYRQDYSAVFWIEAASRESIEYEYIQICKLMYCRPLGIGQETLKVEDAVPAVKDWFHKNQGRWLVVLDSANAIDDDLDSSYIDLGYFMPDAPGVHIVITSRSSTAKDMTPLEAVEVTNMESSEAVELFKRCAKMQDPRQEDEAEVCRIVKELGLLALAITLAGSYVASTRSLSSDIRRFLPEYRSRRKELNAQRPRKQVHQYGESVLSTWETSFKAIKAQNPAAARLLTLLAFMNFDDILPTIFHCNLDIDNLSPEAVALPARTWQSFLSPDTKYNPSEVEAAFGMLERHSLIHWRTDQRSYTMHELVHAWGQDRLDADTQWQLSCVALELLVNATMAKHAYPSCKLRLAPHLMANFAIHLEKHHSTRKVTRDRLTLIKKIGDFLFHIGRLSEAYEIELFHFKKTEEMLGKEHRDTLLSMNDLAAILDSQGEYEEAEQLHRQSLEKLEKVFEEGHPYVLISMSNLAGVLIDRGKYEEAERIYRQTLEIRGISLGEEHPDILLSKSNLAIALCEQGKFEEAEIINGPCVALCTRLLGEEHKVTQISMDALGLCLVRRGKLKEAEQIYRKQLALSERIFGDEYPKTLQSMSNLAFLLSGQRKFKEAEELSKQAVKLSEKSLGNERPETVTILSTLAIVLSSQDKYEEAEGLFRKVVASRELVLGKEHPHTLMSQRSLAGVLGAQGKYEEAERIYEQIRLLEETITSN